MLALRTSRGLDLKEFEKLFNENFLDKYAIALQKVTGYIEVNDGFLKIKDRFLFIQNSIIVEFLQAV